MEGGGVSSGGVEENLEVDSDFEDIETYTCLNDDSLLADFLYDAVKPVSRDPHVDVEEPSQEERRAKASLLVAGDGNKEWRGSLKGFESPQDSNSRELKTTRVKKKERPPENCYQQVDCATKRGKEKCNASSYKDVESLRQQKSEDVRQNNVLLGLERRRKSDNSFFWRREHKRYRHYVYSKLTQIEMRSMMLKTQSHYNLRQQTEILTRPSGPCRKSASVTVCCPGLSKLRCSQSMSTLMQSRFQIICKSQEKCARYVLKNPRPEDTYLLRWIQYMKVQVMRRRGRKYLQHFMASGKIPESTGLWFRDPPGFLQNKLWYAINAKNIGFSDTAMVTYARAGDTECEIIVRNKLMRHVVQYMEVLQNYPDLYWPSKSLRRSEKEVSANALKPNLRFMSQRRAEECFTRSALSQAPVVRGTMRCSTRYFLKRSHFSYKELLKHPDFHHPFGINAQKRYASNTFLPTRTQRRTHDSKFLGDRVKNISDIDKSRYRTRQRPCRLPERVYICPSCRFSSRKRHSSYRPYDKSVNANGTESAKASCCFSRRGKPSKNREETRQSEDSDCEHCFSPHSCSSEDSLINSAFNVCLPIEKIQIPHASSKSQSGKNLKNELADRDIDYCLNEKSSVSSCITYKKPSRLEISDDCSTKRQSLYENIPRGTIMGSYSHDPRLAATSTLDAERILNSSDVKVIENIGDCKHYRPCKNTNTSFKSIDSNFNTFSGEFSGVDISGRHISSPFKPTQVCSKFTPGIPEQSWHLNKTEHGSRIPLTGVAHRLISSSINRNNNFYVVSPPRETITVIGENKTDGGKRQHDTAELCLRTKSLPHAAKTTSQNVGTSLVPHACLTKQNTLDLLDELCAMVRPVSPLDQHQEHGNIQRAATTKGQGNGGLPDNIKCFSFTPIISVNSEMRDACTKNAFIDVVKSKNATQRIQNISVCSIVPANSSQNEDCRATVVKIVGIPHSLEISTSGVGTLQKSNSLQVISCGQESTPDIRDRKEDTGQFKVWNPNNCSLESNLSKYLVKPNPFPNIEAWTKYSRPCPFLETSLTNQRIIESIPPNIREDHLYSTVRDGNMFQEPLWKDKLSLVADKETACCKNAFEDTPSFNCKMDSDVTPALNNMEDQGPEFVLQPAFSGLINDFSRSPTSGTIPISSAFVESTLLSRPPGSPFACNYLNGIDGSSFVRGLPCCSAGPSTIAHAPLDLSNNHGEESTRLKQTENQQMPCTSRESVSRTYRESSSRTGVGNSSDQDYLCDDMCTPIVLNAAERVYHVSGAALQDEDFLDLSLRQILSCESNMREVVNELSLAGSMVDVTCHTCIETTLGNRDCVRLQEDSRPLKESFEAGHNQEQDLLSKAMLTAGLTDDDIESFLMSSDPTLESFLTDESMAPIEALSLPKHLSCNSFVRDQQNEADSTLGFFNSRTGHQSDTSSILPAAYSAMKGNTEERSHANLVPYIRLDTRPRASSRTEPRCFNLKESPQEEISILSSSQQEIAEPNGGFCKLTNVSDDDQAHNHSLNINTNEMQGSYEHLDHQMDINVLNMQHNHVDMTHKTNSLIDRERKRPLDKICLSQNTEYCNNLVLSWPSFQEELGFHNLKEETDDSFAPKETRHVYIDAGHDRAQVLHSSPSVTNDSEELCNVLNLLPLPDEFMEQHEEEEKEDEERTEKSDSRKKTTGTGSEMRNHWKVESDMVYQTHALQSPSNSSSAPHCSEHQRGPLHACVEDKASPCFRRSLRFRPGSSLSTRSILETHAEQQVSKSKLLFKARNIFLVGETESVSANSHPEGKTSRGKCQLKHAKSNHRQYRCRWTKDASVAQKKKLRHGNNEGDCDYKETSSHSIRSKSKGKDARTRKRDVSNEKSSSVVLQTPAQQKRKEIKIAKKAIQPGASETNNLNNRNSTESLQGPNKSEQASSSSSYREPRGSFDEEHMKNENLAAERFTQQLLASSPGFLQKVSQRPKTSTLQSPVWANRVSTNIKRPLTASRRRRTLRSASAVPNSMYSPINSHSLCAYHDNRNNNSNDTGGSRIERGNTPGGRDSVETDGLSTLKKSAINSGQKICFYSTPEGRFCSQNLSRGTESQSGVYFVGSTSGRPASWSDMRITNVSLKKKKIEVEHKHVRFKKNRFIGDGIQTDLNRCETMNTFEIFNDDRDTILNDSCITLSQSCFSNNNAESKVQSLGDLKDQEKQYRTQCIGTIEININKISQLLSTKHSNVKENNKSSISKSSRHDKTNTSYSCSNVKGKTRWYKIEIYGIRPRIQPSYTSRITRGFNRNNNSNCNSSEECNSDTSNNAKEKDPVGETGKGKVTKYFTRGTLPKPRIETIRDSWHQKETIIQELPRIGKNMENFHAARRKLRDINAKLTKIHGKQIDGFKTISSPASSGGLGSDKSIGNTSEAASRGTIGTFQGKHGSVCGQNREKLPASIVSNYRSSATGPHKAMDQYKEYAEMLIPKTRLGSRSSASPALNVNMRNSTKDKLSPFTVHEEGQANVEAHSPASHLERQECAKTCTTRSVEMRGRPSALNESRFGQKDINEYSKEINKKAREGSDYEKQPETKNALSEERRGEDVSSSNSQCDVDSGLARFVERLNSGYGRQLAEGKAHNKDQLEKLCSRYLETLNARRREGEKLVGGLSSSFNRESIKAALQMDNGTRSHSVPQDGKRRTVSVGGLLQPVEGTEKQRGTVAKVKSWEKDCNENMTKSYRAGMSMKEGRRLSDNSILINPTIGAKKQKIVCEPKNKAAQNLNKREASIRTPASSSLITGSNPVYSSQENIGQKKSPRLRSDIKESVERLSMRSSSPLMRLQYDINTWETNFGKSFDLSLSKDDKDIAMQKRAPRRPASCSSSVVHPTRPAKQHFGSPCAERLLPRYKKLGLSRSLDKRSNPGSKTYGEPTKLTDPGSSSVSTKTVPGGIGEPAKNREEKINTFFGSLLNLIDQKEKQREKKQSSYGVRESPSQKQQRLSPRKGVCKAGSSEVGAMYRNMLEKVKAKRSSFTIDLDEHLKIPPLSEFQEMAESPAALLNLPDLISEPKLINIKESKADTAANIEKCTPDVKLATHRKSIDVNNPRRVLSPTLKLTKAKHEDLSSTSETDLTVPQKYSNLNKRPKAENHSATPGVGRGIDSASKLKAVKKKSRAKMYPTHSDEPFGGIFEPIDNSKGVLGRERTSPDVTGDIINKAFHATALQCAASPSPDSEFLDRLKAVIKDDFVTRGGADGIGDVDYNGKNGSRGGGGRDGGEDDDACEKEALFPGGTKSSEKSSFTVQREQDIKGQKSIGNVLFNSEDCTESPYNTTAIISDISFSGEEQSTLHTSLGDELLSSTVSDEVLNCYIEKSRPHSIYANNRTNDNAVLYKTSLGGGSNWSSDDQFEPRANNYNSTYQFQFNKDIDYLGKCEGRSEANAFPRHSEKTKFNSYSDPDERPQLFMTDTLFETNYRRMPDLTDLSGSYYGKSSLDSNVASLDSQFDIKPLESLERQAEQDFGAIYMTSLRTDSRRRSNTQSHWSQSHPDQCGEPSAKNYDWHQNPLSPDNSMGRPDGPSFHRQAASRGSDRDIHKASVANHASSYSMSDHLYADDSSYKLDSPFANACRLRPVSAAGEGSLSFYGSYDYREEQTSSRGHVPDIPWNQIGATSPTKANDSPISSAVFNNPRQSLGHSFLTPIQEESEEDQR